MKLRLLEVKIEAILAYILTVNKAADWPTIGIQKNVPNLQSRIKLQAHYYNIYLLKHFLYLLNQFIIVDVDQTTTILP